MKRLSLPLLLFFMACISASAEEYRIDGVYPSHWWVGMKNPKLQIMIYGSNVNENSFSISYPGIQLLKVNKVENRNYVFLDILITSAAKP